MIGSCCIVTIACSIVRGEEPKRVGGLGRLLGQADIAEADIPVLADGALLCAVHDVMRSPAALANVLSHLRPRARIVAGGPKWAPWLRSGAVSMNLRTWKMNRQCVTTFDGFRQPWSYLELLADNLVVDEVFLGGGYIASGTRPRCRA